MPFCGWVVALVLLLGSSAWRVQGKQGISETLRRIREVQPLARPGYGVLFREVAKNIHATGSYRELIFVLDEPHLRELKLMEPVRVCGVEGVDSRSRNFLVMQDVWSDRLLMVRCLSLETDLNSRLLLYNQRVPIINEMTRTLRALLRNLEAPGEALGSRDKRFFLTMILGPRITGPAFGLATAEDLQILQDHVIGLNLADLDLADGIADVKDTMAQIVATNNDRFESVWGRLSGITDQVNRQTNITHKWRQNFADRFRGFQASSVFSRIMLVDLLGCQFRIEALVADSADYLAALLDWQGAVLALGKGRLSEYLVPSGVMTAQLEIMQGELNLENRGLNLLYDEDQLAYYYTEQLVTFIAQDGRLFLEVKVPIGPQEGLITVYYVDVYALPVTGEDGTNSGSGVGYTELVTEPKYLAVSAGGTLFKSLLAEEYQACQRSLHFGCPYLATMQDQRGMSCLSSLFQELYDEALELCEFRYYPQEPVTRVVPLGGAAFLVINPRVEVLVQRGVERELLVLAPVMMIELPCGAELAADAIKVPVTLHRCQGIREVRVGSLVNMAALLVSQRYRSSGSPVRFSEVLNRTQGMPKLELSLLPSLVNFSLEDKQRGLLLKDAVQELIERTPGNMTRRHWTPRSFYRDMPWELGVTLGVSWAWLAATGISVFIVHRQVSQLRLLVMILQTTRGVRAQQGEQQAEWWGPEAYLLMAATLGMVGALVSLTIVVLQLMRNVAERQACSQCATNCVLIIPTDQVGVNVRVRQIPAPLQRVEVLRMPLVSLVGVQRVYGWQHAALIEWTGALIIRVLGETRHLELPATVAMGWTAARVVKNRWLDRGARPLALDLRLEPGCWCANRLSIGRERRTPLIPRLLSRGQMYVGARAPPSPSNETDQTEVSEERPPPPHPTREEIVPSSSSPGVSRSSRDSLGDIGRREHVSNETMPAAWCDTPGRSPEDTSPYDWPPPRARKARASGCPREEISRARRRLEFVHSSPRLNVPENALARQQGETGGSWGEMLVASQQDVRGRPVVLTKLSTCYEMQPLGVALRPFMQIKNNNRLSSPRDEASHLSGSCVWPGCQGGEGPRTPPPLGEPVRK